MKFFKLALVEDEAESRRHARMREDGGDVADGWR